MSQRHYKINQDADLSATRGEWRVTMKNIAKNFDFKVIDGEITITKYQGTDTEVVIPSEINGMPVTNVGQWILL